MHWGPVGLAVLAAALAVGTLACGDDEDDASEHVDVAVIGDSFAAQSRDQFLALARGNRLAAEYHAYGGTALCDWQNWLQQLIDQEPDQLVLAFAGNDVTACMNNTGAPRDPAAVAAIYRDEIDRWIDLFRAGGTDIYVVEPPPIRDPQFEANAAAMREMYQDLDNEVPRVSVIDTSSRLGPDGEFHAALPCVPGDQACGPDGNVVLRQDDGIHLTPPGGQRYAEAMMDELIDHATP